jgi:hypothetical protein
MERRARGAEVAVTARHYMRWAGGDVYRQSMMLEPGEIPADALRSYVE